MPILSKKAIISQAKTLIGNAEIKATFDLLHSYPFFKGNNDIILLNSQWSHWYKKTLLNIVPQGDVEGNKILYGLLGILSELQTNISTTIFNQAPRPVDKIIDSEGNLLGREHLVAIIHEKLAQQAKIFALKGIGGIGKTTLAQHYCHTAQANETFDTIYWISLAGLDNQTDKSEIVLQNRFILHFTPILNLDKIASEQQLSQIQAHFTDTSQSCLLVLDNADDKNLIEQNLPWLRSLNIPILITTRADIVNIDKKDVEVLEEPYAIQLFKLFCPDRFHEKEIKSLIQTLYGHTLLIEICAKTLYNDDGLDISDIITAAQNNKLDILHVNNIMVERDNTTHNSVANFLFSIFQLSFLSAAEQLILSYFSVLLNRDYSLTLLETWFVFPADFENPPKLSTLLTGLVQKGWLQRKYIEVDNKKQPAYACHILLRHVIFQQLKPNTKSIGSFLEAIQKDTDYNPYRNEIEQTEYIEELIEIVQKFKDEKLIIAYIYSSLQYLYVTIGNYNIALDYGKKYITIVENINPEDKNIIAIAYNNIALTYRHIRNYELSLMYHLKAISIRKKNLTKNNLDLGISYNNIGRTYRYLQNYKKALAYHLKAIVIYEKLLPENHPDLATSYNNISGIYEDLKNYDKALEYYRKSINIREKVLEKNHPSLGLSYLNVAITYYKMCNYDIAKNYIEKAVLIFTKMQPKNYLMLQDLIKLSLKNHPYIISALEWQEKINKALSENS